MMRIVKQQIKIILLLTIILINTSLIVSANKEIKYEMQNNTSLFYHLQRFIDSIKPLFQKYIGLNSILLNISQSSNLQTSRANTNNDICTIIENNQTKQNGISIHKTTIENHQPKTDLILGNPHIVSNNNWWISSKTNISLYSYTNITQGNESNNNSYIFNLYYSYYENDSFFEYTIFDQDANDIDRRIGFVNTTFTLNDSCLQSICYYATDISCNNESMNYAELTVDNSPPNLTYSYHTTQNPSFYQYYDEYFYHLDEQWYTGIPNTTQIVIQALGGANHDTGCNNGVGFNQIGYERFWGETPAELELQENNIQQIPNVSTDVIKSGWHEIDFWTEDLLNNKNPGEGETESHDFIVDSQGPQIEGSYHGPIYTSEGTIWITNKTQKTLHAKDAGGIPGGSGVHRIEWRIDKKTTINDEWEPMKSGIIYDNGLEDTDGSPARPTQGLMGGIYSFDYKGEPFVFMDTNHNWIFDPEIDSIISLDPDEDGFIQQHIAEPGKFYPIQKEQGGLWAMDWRNEPYLFIDTNVNSEYDPLNDILLNTDADEDAPQYIANPKQGEKGGLFAFDESNETFTFIDYNGNFQFDEEADKVLCLKPDYDGSREITCSLNIEEDCIHRFVYQGFDMFNTPGPKYKDIVYVDNTPPTTSIYANIPSCDECITKDTEITIQTKDQQEPCQSGIKSLYYKIDEMPFETHSSEVKFTFDTEGWHQVVWYATDNLGNIETQQQKYYCVDQQQPIIAIEIEKPYEIGPGEPDYWITPDTNITIFISNDGCCEDFTARFTLNEQTYILTKDEAIHGYTIPSLLFTEETRYHLQVEAFDCLFNSVFEERVYYVDRTAPNISIWSPQNGGFYSDGSIISCVAYAEDHHNIDPICSEVGIQSGAQASTYILDVFHNFKVQPLANINLTYDPNNQGSSFFRGIVQIPSDSNITDDGPVLFILEAEDTLGNDQNTHLDTIYAYYNQSKGNENLFKSLIQNDPQLSDDIAWINIDNTPPTAEILIPCLDDNCSIIGPDSFEIHVSASDAFSGIDASYNCHITLKNNLLGSISFNPLTQHFEGTLEIPNDISGLAPLEAEVFDKAGNNAVDTIMVFVNNNQNTPRVQILNPNHLDQISSKNVTVSIEASDIGTITNQLRVQLQVTIPNYCEFVYNPIYSPQTDSFIFDLNLSTIKNNSHIYLQAFASDNEGNVGSSSIVEFTVKNNVYFAQWMESGWNLIEIYHTVDNTSIPAVFHSIIDSYHIIFELNTELYYISDQHFNTLSEISPGHQYWVKMKEESGFYLKK